MEEDRPHAPSAHKRKRAREAGEVARSPLASAAMVLLAGGAAVALAGPGWIDAWRAFATRALSGEASIDEAMRVAAAGLAAPLAACVAVGALASFLQVGPLFTLAPMAPDLGRLDPARGLARLFSGPELAARLGPLALAALVLALALDAVTDGAGLLGRAALPPAAALGAIGSVAGAFFARACGLLAVAGAVALVYRRWRWLVDQRMSRRELLREQRELEGEPGARARRDQIRRTFALAPSRAEAIAGATLVVHGDGVSVLVGWDGGEAAPRVLLVARGPAIQLPSSIATALDAVLAAELAAVSPGAPVPRGAWRRLASWLARRAA